MGNDPTIEDYFEKVVELIDDEEFEKALDLLDIIIKLDPHNFDAYYGKTQIFEDLGDHKNALDSINKALDINPESIDALNWKGAILLNLDETYKSIDYFNKVLEIDSNYYFALKNKGIALFFLGKYQDSLEFLSMASLIDNQDDDLLNYKGNVLTILENFDEALNCFKESLAIDDENPDTYYLMSLTLWGCDKGEESLVCLDKALKIYPEYSDALIAKGMLYRDLEKPEKALKCFNKLIEYEPDNFNAWFELGNVFKDLRRTKESINAYETFIDIVRKNNISDMMNKVTRTVEYLNWVKDKGEAVTFTPRKNPQFWQWSTRSEYFLEKDGREREVLEPGISRDPGSWWTCHKDTLAGDLILIYRAGKHKGKTYQDIKYLVMARSDAYPLEIEEAVEKTWKYGCDYIPLFKFKNSLKLDQMKNEPTLEGWNALNALFIKQAFATDKKYWKYLNDILSDLNPDYKHFLAKFDRKKVIAKIQTEAQFEKELVTKIYVMKKFGYDLEVIGQQQPIGSGGFIDIECRDKNTGEYVILELKIGKANRNVFGQISEYVGWVLGHNAEDKPVKGIVISRGMDKKFEAALNTNPNIEQIELSEVLGELGMKLR